MAYEPSLPSASCEGVVLKGTYEVFLSFRGEDTRKGFVSHLYRALKDRGIHTFRDDERLERGKSISAEILRAIDESKIAIVVFSKNYAASSWCLDELANIVETKHRFVIPVFYDVDPSDIRKHQNCVAEALARYGSESADKLQRWKEALTKAANFSGYDVPNTSNGDESECIKGIVVEVFDKLSQTITNSQKGVVGMKWRVDKVMSMLRVDESDTVLMVGIWGMGGTGKTTVASAIFHKLSNLYDASCFLRINTNVSSHNEIKQLQVALLSKILKLDHIYLFDIGEGTNLIKARLGSMKVLIVLDNVNNKQQLDALAAEHDWFGPGSRIIMTTRDSHLLNQVDDSYEVELLNNVESMQLFCWHAFRQNHPLRNFANLSSQVLEYAKGLPLALHVLGSHLWGLSMEEWSNEITKLQKVPHDEILSALKISYDGLDDVNKSIFLDVACFFGGWVVTKVIRILDSYEFYFKRGIRPLLRKSLISEEDGKIKIHDLVQEMGRNIVRTNHPRSRLWELEEIIDVLSGDQDSEAVEGIICTSLIPEEIIFSDEALKKMKRLRLLSLRCNRAPEYIPSQLRWMHWDEYPQNSLPKDFEGRKLVGFITESSLIVEPITIYQRFESLKILHLSRSPMIRRTPDVSKVPHLEELIMGNCFNLEEVHSSFGIHKTLQLVDFSGCKKLKVLPLSLKMESLKRLNLGGCDKLEKFPEIEANSKMMALEELNLLGTGIRELPYSFIHLTGLLRLNLSFTGIKKSLDFSWSPYLEELIMNNCENLVEVHSSFGLHKNLQLVDFSECKNLKILLDRLEMESLKRLNLCGCKKLEIFPEIEGNNMMTALEELDLSGTQIRRLPHSFRYLTSLRRLNLRVCRRLGSDLHNRLRQWENLERVLIDEENMSDLALHDIIAMRIVSKNIDEDGPLLRTLIFSLPAFLQLVHLNLSAFYLSHIVIPQTCLPSLQELDIKVNDDLQELVISKECFSSLRKLDLRGTFRSYPVEQSNAETRLQDLFNHLLHIRDHFSTVSLIKSAYTSRFIPGDPQISEAGSNEKWVATSFNWEAMLSTLHERKSELMLLMPGNEIKKSLFQLQVDRLPCDLILPPTPSWYTSKFRGLAICGYMPNMTSGTGVNINIKYCCQKLTTEFWISPEHMLFQYIPIGSLIFQCCLSNYNLADEPSLKICLLDVWGTTADLKWGIRLVYDEDEADESFNYEDVTVIPFRFDELTRVAHLRVLCDGEENR